MFCSCKIQKKTEKKTGGISGSPAKKQNPHFSLRKFVQKRHFTKCKKYVIMILCIPCAFPTDSQSNFMLYFNNFTIHRKKALPMQKAARIIGICLSRVQEEYRLQCIKAFNQHASAKGYRLFIFNAKSDFFLPPCGGSPPRQNAVHACRICRK